MKRMHIHVSVENIQKSAAFYSKLFGTDPIVLKDDYAKWMLDDPCVNFALSSHDGAHRGIEHVGIQVDDAEELAEVYDRMRDAGQPIFDEGATVCCYAQSDKNWTADPDGIAWEAFLTQGEETEYGNRVDLDQLASAKAVAGSCCTPAVAPAGTGFANKHLAVDVSCCGEKP
ncbi:MAG: ArsI/CadI family heavy metal resistance metalloenzyme [Parasphingorhabdus sp.]|uniref:ArsI/CadI family heavy metal resistance metalloenzyme n=1 Tax=Parasphingorhabdus sp. TaxID=2709688 RepID=UPI00300148E0